MKKLRFLGIMTGCFLFFLSCGFSHKNSILAYDCLEQVQESFVRRPPSTNVDGPVSYNPTSYSLGKKYYLDNGESVCGTNEFSGFWWGGGIGSKYYRPTVIKCENGKIGEVECEDRWSACTNVGGEESPKAECKNVGSCTYSGSVNSYYNLKGEVINFSDDDRIFKNEGETACFGIEVKRCNIQSGEWSSNDVNVLDDYCNDNQSCYMHQSVGGFMYASCEDDCRNPDGKAEDAVCSSDKKSVLKCYGSKWNSKSLSDYFGKSDCVSCEMVLDSEGKYLPTCGKNTGEKLCTKINSKVVTSGKDGSFLCGPNEEGEKLYRCDTLSNEFLTDGSYSQVEDCSLRNDGKVKCGIGANGIDTCMTEDELRENDQSRSSVDISVSTDSGFLCTVNGEDGIETALGCIPYSMSGLAGKLLPLLFGIAGGISFLLMVFGFIMVATSSGDEKKLMEARSRITSAIIGLLVSIFAIFLFRLIFSNILKIPGL